MQIKAVWQQGSQDTSNADNFAAIQQWWTGLNGKEIRWQQRLIPENGDLTQLSWDPQRFDEAFVLTHPTLRGITLFWRKPDSPDERSTTPSKLELNGLQQQLYIYPQSQKNLVIRVALPQVVYQTVKISQPQLALTQTAGQTTLMIRDEVQRLEIQVVLTPERLAQLKQQINE